ncbi:MAG: chromate transporter [Candidatus Eremiobacteraeota bacterium]|nr:chromate transporter [Candidatus Eremiobacteraeota bacterium]
MSESVVPATATAVARPKVALGDLFLTFLIIGATSFGGGVVAYLRNAMVAKKQWFTDVEFLELTSISNTLPGLNATNMAILAGDRLCGPMGSVAAMIGMCVPAFIFMTAAGIIYNAQASRPIANAALHGVAAAAVGLIAATWYQIGKKSVKGFYDAFFILAAVLGINHFKFTVPEVLLVVGAVAIFANRPRKPEKESTEQWISSLR